MKKHSPTRALRDRPDLNQLKRQAKELLRAFARGEEEALAEVNAHYRDADGAAFALHDAQLVLARSYGFDSWPKLRAYVDGVTAARMCDAVERGDIQAVGEMLGRRPEIVNLERPDHGEQRALHIAVLGRDGAMVRLLMDRGADARIGIWPHRDATGAYTFAIERGYDEIASIIEGVESRRSGSPAPARTVPGLEEAMRRGDQQRAIAMLESDPSLIHASDMDGWTPLHRAAAMLHEHMVAWLVERGADVNRQGKAGWPPMDLAASGRGWGKAGTPERFASVAKMLRGGAEMTSISAVALGEGEWVRDRHAEGKLVDATVLDLFGPFGGLLTTAVRHGQSEMLTLLLDLGLDPDERVRLDGTEEVSYSWGQPLHSCAGSGKLELAGLLLERGADPNGEVSTSGTPVGIAYGRRDQSMVQLLERYGGVVYAANAGYYRDTGLARRLLADETAGRLREGTVESGKTLAETLLDSAASGGDPEIVGWALERIDWASDDPRWYRMLWSPLVFWNHLPGIPSANPDLDRATYITCFGLVLERCDPNIRPDRFGQTILHEVAAMGNHVRGDETVAFAKLLLGAGARMDVRDDLLRSTPLGWACRWGRPELVKLLLERGADPVEPEAEPWSRPLAWAEKMGHHDVARMLGPLADSSSS